MNPSFISASSTGLGNTVLIFGFCAFSIPELEPSQKGPIGCTQLLAWWKCVPFPVSSCSGSDYHIGVARPMVRFPA